MSNRPPRIRETGVDRPDHTSWQRLLKDFVGSEVTLGFSASDDPGSWMESPPGILADVDNPDGPRLVTRFGAEIPCTWARLRSITEVS